MRRVAIIALVTVATWIYFANSRISFSSSPVAVAPIPTVIIKPNMPVKLVIPTIHLETGIFPVGLTVDNIVDTLPHDVGWYKDGVRPGEKGTAVLDGHVTGIFAYISKLNVGDDIYTLDNTNQRFHFRVTEKDLVDVEKFSVDKVYGHTDKPRLNLITCAGNYNPATKDFNQRTIIYSELVGN